jgi:16S rRNA G966 N2-methylase RsmD
MDKCYFVDLNPIAYKTIKNNLEILKIEKDMYEVYKGDYLAMIKFFKRSDIKFDYIFLDPPYHIINNSDVIKHILENDIINIGGEIVLEHLKDLEIDLLDSFEIKKKKNISIRDIIVLERIR